MGIKNCFTLAELADLLSAQLIGNPLHRINGANALDKATEQEASFLANPRYREAMKESLAGVVCIDPSTLPLDGKNYLISPDPSRTFQQIVELFHSCQIESAFKGVHPTAIIDPSVRLGQNVTIGPYAVIDCQVRIGDGTTIGAHTFIGAGVQIGSHCHIYPSCVVRERCRLGDRVILQSGAIVGSCGFGYTTDQNGCHHKLEQIGIVGHDEGHVVGAEKPVDQKVGGEVDV